MAFTRTTTINSAPGGDSVKQAVLDLDTDLTGAFGHLNTLDATKAPIAKGVTNGDSHDHSGGDGAQIAYSGLSGLPTLGSMAAQNTGTYAGPGSSQAFTVGAFTQTGNALLAQTTGNALFGTTTDDGVNKLQVNGSASFTGALNLANNIKMNTVVLSATVPSGTHTPSEIITEVPIPSGVSGLYVLQASVDSNFGVIYSSTVFSLTSVYDGGSHATSMTVLSSQGYYNNDYYGNAVIDVYATINVTVLQIKHGNAGSTIRTLFYRVLRLL